ncbi:glutathione S-transferase family protein [Sphingomonas sp. CGMCC 1.13654]|uniref:Glutathione S-transferase family protein n=1 Tax=Sphingomonas chungangi TaxID=2683589 RepID=A0A838LB11_9SPHN|nr:glutathione S-transferase family protein [Sphingomonas chungangi]MBA2936050.1 glutathione S-transferase family protein [Sphingomonas chungangi]MVW55439.1 glutathione S-transferase family protein [Sphingomonas chungangi]
MSPLPVLHAHLFSSYCWKVLIALYENETPFELRLVEDEASWAELERLWPMKLMPVLVDGDREVVESSIIIEYLALFHSGPVSLIPFDPDKALRVRFLDRAFDSYVMTPMNKIVGDHLRSEADRDAYGVSEARAKLDRSYRWIETCLADGGWAAGADFTLADCAAAPSLFYADWVHPIPADCPKARDYRARLLARPSVARAVDEARPYRRYFPPGAPDRD